MWDTRVANHLLCGYLDTWRRAGVWPDSVQVPGAFTHGDWACNGDDAGRDYTTPTPTRSERGDWR
jgi:hypothetical protein